MTKNKTYIMMCGFPGCGKSTLVSNLVSNSYETTVLSTDDYIEKVAKGQEKTYSECFDSQIKNAEKFVASELQTALDRGNNIIVDQTNITRSSRYKKLSKIPSEHYTKICFVVKCDEKERQKRMRNRNRKNIPPAIDLMMQEMYVKPTHEEGFDFVYEVITS